VSLNILLSDSRSLKVIRNDTVEWGVCNSLLLFHWIYVFCTVSEIFSVKKRRDLEIGGKGRSTSLKMAPFDRSYNFLLVGHCKDSCILYHLKVIWRWVIVTFKRSLQVIQTGDIRKLGCGFLFAFYSNYGRIFNRLWDIQSQRIAWPWDLG